MENYHGILVNVSQKDETIFSKLKIVGQKEDDGWILYKIEIKPEEVTEIINDLQNNLSDSFYFHIYKDDELIVIFKNKIFITKTDKSTWKEILGYGKLLNIPSEQLDFYPCKTEDEKF